MYEGWRQRLSAAIDESGKSMNAVSSQAELAPNYVHGILKLNKEPTLDRLLRVCDAVPVSAVWIIHGHEVRPEDEALLRLLHQHPDARQAILALLAASETI